MCCGRCVVAFTRLLGCWTLLQEAIGCICAGLRSWAMRAMQDVGRFCKRRSGDVLSLWATLVGYASGIATTEIDPHWEIVKLCCLAACPLVSQRITARFRLNVCIRQRWSAFSSFIKIGTMFAHISAVCPLGLCHVFTHQRLTAFYIEKSPTPSIL